MQQTQEQPKYHNAAKNYGLLSIGFSVVIAIVLGVIIGIGLRNYFKQEWLLFLGIFWGLAAATLNIYRPYKKFKAELEQEAKSREQA